MTTTDILKKAFNITIRNPGLWLLAFFASFDISSIFDLVREVVEPRMDDLSGVIIAAFFITVIVIVIVYMFLSAFALAAMIGQIGKALDGESASIRHGLKTARPDIGRIIGINLRLVALILGLVTAMVLVFIVAIAFPDGVSEFVIVLLGIPMFIGLVVASFTFGVVKKIAVISLVETGGDGRECIRRAWNLLRRRTKRVLGFYFLTWFIQFAISMIVALPILIVSAMIAVGGDAETGVFLSLALDLLLRIIGVIVVVALSSPVTVFDFTAWTLFYRRLRGLRIPK